MVKDFIIIVVILTIKLRQPFFIPWQHWTKLIFDLTVLFVVIMACMINKISDKRWHWKLTDNSIPSPMLITSNDVKVGKNKLRHVVSTISTPPFGTTR